VEDIEVWEDNEYFHTNFYIKVGGQCVFGQLLTVDLISLSCPDLFRAPKPYTSDM